MMQSSLFTTISLYCCCQFYCIVLAILYVSLLADFTALVLSDYNRRMNRCMILIRSLQLEFPRLGSNLNKMRNDIWSYAMPRTNALIFTYPNFQFVRLIVSVYEPSHGMRDLRYRTTASRFRTFCATKRWICLKLDSREALPSNAPASLDRQTVCTAHRAASSMEKHLMLARFMDALNIGRITEKISLLLCRISRFRHMVIMW